MAQHDHPHPTPRNSSHGRAGNSHFPLRFVVSSHHVYAIVPDAPLHPRPEGPAQLSALGNAQGKEHTTTFRPYMIRFMLYLSARLSIGLAEEVTPWSRLCGPSSCFRRPRQPSDSPKPGQYPEPVVTELAFIRRGIRNRAINEPSIRDRNAQWNLWFG